MKHTVLYAYHMFTDSLEDFEPRIEILKLTCEEYPKSYRTVKVDVIYTDFNSQIYPTHMCVGIRILNSDLNTLVREASSYTFSMYTRVNCLSSMQHFLNLVDTQIHNIIDVREQSLKNMKEMQRGFNHNLNRYKSLVEVEKNEAKSE